MTEKLPGNETIDMQLCYAAIDSIENLCLQRMTRAAFMSTLAALTCRKDPLHSSLPIKLEDYVDALYWAFEAAVSDHPGNTFSKEKLTYHATRFVQLSGRVPILSEIDSRMLIEMFGYAFSNMPHLAYLAAGGVPTEWF